ncbi:MAG TPA: hypothetical protein DEQ09_02770 [Bacteroidales bacterium]|nr:hypothetical protein [Bacteroidales bacterium]
MNKLYLFLLILLVCLSSCEKKRYFRDDEALLVFTDDTIHFDTVFTSIGTVTKELRVINPYRSWINIDKIYLAGGHYSPFRLNVDGVPANNFTNIEIGPFDSIFIFIDAIIDPGDKDNPVLINDSVVFEINASVQDVNLIAWGQDINLLDGAVIGTETWMAGKPYVVYNSLMVDTGHVLTINEGARVLFHRGSSLYIAGSLIVNGTVESPVIFASDRIEEIYSDVPGQWQGLYFLNGSSGNRINNASIINAVTGIHSGNLGTPDPAPDMELYNVLVSHMSVSGLSSLGSRITAQNMLISHCGYYCTFLAMGGDYSFTHCTIANQWDYSNRISPSVYISDYYDYNETRYAAQLVKAGFYNSVITGRKGSEIYITSVDQKQLNIEFINCLIQDEYLQQYTADNCIFNQDPLFLSWSEYDFRPDNLSPLINKGAVYYANIVPADMRGNSRIDDEAPDIGAYEKQPGENDTQK